MSDKIYRVQMNSSGMLNFATAVEIADRPQGEWIDCKGGWKCMACNKWSDGQYNFCPSCGAKMKGKDDEDNH